MLQYKQIVANGENTKGLIEEKDMPALDAVRGHVESNHA